MSLCPGNSSVVACHSLFADFNRVVKQLYVRSGAWCVLFSNVMIVAILHYDEWNSCLAAHVPCTMVLSIVIFVTFDVKTRSRNFPSSFGRWLI